MTEKTVSNTVRSSGRNSYDRHTWDAVIIPEATKKGYTEAHDGDGVYINRPYQKRGVVQNKKIPTLKTTADIGVIDGLRIRKLTPKECWRLMDFEDWMYEKAKESGVSHSQLYKQAGNSIVVSVPVALFTALKEQGFI